MAFIDWDDSLSVKIDSIDNEHKKLIGMINEFYDNVKEESSTELVVKIVRRMREYTQTHFRSEESYMRIYNDPGYLKHKEEHDSFVDKVKDVEERCANGKLVASFEITNFLKKWIRDHIQKTDKQYTQLLLKNGVK